MYALRWKFIVTILLAGSLSLPSTLLAQATDASKSTEKCQKAAQKEAGKLAAATQKALGNCLQKIAGKVVKDNQLGVDVAGATGTCLAQFYKIGGTDGKSLADKMEAKVAKKC